MMVYNEEPKIIGLSTDTTPKNPVRRSATKQEKSNITTKDTKSPARRKPQPKSKEDCTTKDAKGTKEEIEM
jgi:hypothetical protein